MSKILDQLKQAEAQRERLAAQRAAAQVAPVARAPADAAASPSAGQIEARPAAPEPPPARSPWRWFAAPAAAALGFALYYAALPGPVSPPQQAAVPPASYSWGLRFDRDDAAFAARVKAREKR